MSPKNSPSARYAVPIYDAAHGEIVMTGGGSSAGPLADTWVWDGSNWTQKSPSSSPAAVTNGVFDAALNKVVVFDSGLYPWVWDGSNWTQMFPPARPPARTAYGMAYDRAHGQVVLFGGRDANANDFGDTWVWDGTNWAQVRPQTSPAPRSGPGMVYDAAHGQVVLFGGLETASLIWTNETWVWDGSNWTQKFPSASPSGRWAFAMTYDAGHGQVVLFGGAPAIYTFADDTWSWDGSNWAQIAPPNHPSARVTKMAYDSLHEQIVLFGGYGPPPNTVYYGDTWVLKSSPLPQTSMSIASGDKQAGPAGVPLPSPIVVAVSDVLGNPVAGVNVNFTATNATVNAASAMTDSMGFASAQVTLGNSVGPATVAATSTGLASVTFNFSVLPPQPSIDAGGVVPLNSSNPVIQPGSWISIYGHNLVAGAPATWNGDFPTTLGGASVTINGKPGYLYFASSNQINLQAPDDDTTGTVDVMVKNPLGSATTTVMLGPVGPSFNLLDNRHIAGIILRSDGSGSFGGGTYDIVGPTGNSLGYPTVAAKPGDTLELFGIGFGPTNPHVPAGMGYSGAALALDQVQLSINGVAVTPSFVGLTSAGLFQFNVTLPGGLGNGDLPLAATVAGVQTPANIVLSVQ